MDDALEFLAFLNSKIRNGDMTPDEVEADLAKDGLSLAVVRQLAQQQLMASQQEQPAPTAQPNIPNARQVMMAETGMSPDVQLDGMNSARARNLAQGATLNFADEIEATVRAPFDSERRGQILEDVRADVSSLPGGEALAWQMAGTAPLMLLPFGVAAKGTNLLQKIAMGSLIGGTEGALAGAGAGTDTSERVTGGIVGATIGAGVGGLLPAAGAATRLGRGADLVEEAVGDSGGPRALVDGLAEGDMLADLSPRLRHLGRGAMGIPNRATDDVTTTLVGRSENIRGSIEDAARRSLDVEVAAADSPEMFNRLTTTLRENAKDAYKEAYAVGLIDDDRLRPIIEKATRRNADSALNSAWAEAIQLARDEGADISRMVRLADDGSFELLTPSVEVLDYFKQGLDSVIDRGMRGSDKITKKRAFSLRRNIRDPLMDVLDDIEPYRAARAQYAGDLEMRDALEAGTAAFNKSPKVIRQELAELTDAAKDMYRVGWLSRLDDDLGRAGSSGRALGNISRRTIPRNSQVEVLFPNGDVARFEDELRRLQRQQTTKNTVLGGSRTAAFQEDIGQFSPGFANALRDQRGAGNIMRSAVDAGVSRLSGAKTARSAEEAARLLFLTDPEEYLVGLMRREPEILRSAANRTRRSAATSLFGAGLATEFANRGLLDRR